MNERQELDRLLTDCTKGKHKEMAFNQGSSLNTIERECNGSIKYNCIEKLQVFMDAEDGDRIMQKVCEMQGGIFVSIPEIKPGGGALIVSELLKEFSELTAEIGKSFSDGKIDKAEIKRMRKELADINSVAEGFFISAERGDYDDK